MNINFTETQIEVLKHTIGWNKNNQPRKYGKSKPILNVNENCCFQNYETSCEELYKMGIMNKRCVNSPYNNLPYYYVTPYGFKVIEEYFNIKIKQD